MKTLLLATFALLTLGAAGTAYYYYSNGRNATVYREATVERGKLAATISATGTIMPEEIVDVGAQVAGRIKSFGRDPRDPSKPIDYNTEVEKDTVLAQIDDALYSAEVDLNKADLGFAQANVRRADAELVVMRARLYQTERDYARAKKLGTGAALSSLEYDTIQNAYESTKAALPGGEAAVAQAREAVEKARATLKRAQTNLDYTTIKSPIRGVIIDRRVNIGQTVVASLNAPSLFLIAKDLKRMQVWASVNEADVNNITKGQPVRFTVDGSPASFQGEVMMVRLNASMTQNVVTYTVVVSTDNSDGRLRPYQTANLQFLVSEHDNVLQIPNEALRWRPSAAQVAQEFRADYARSLRRRGSAADQERQDRATVWVKENGHVRPVKIRTGLSDGLMTEVVDGLDENASVVVGEIRQDDNEGTTNPFITPTFGGNRPKQQ